MQTNVKSQSNILADQMNSFQQKILQNMLRSLDCNLNDFHKKEDPKIMTYLTSYKTKICRATERDVNRLVTSSEIDQRKFPGDL